jgi:hypothetical protein
MTVPVTAEDRVHVQVSSYGICDGQTGTGTSFSPSSLVFSCHYYSPLFRIRSYGSIWVIYIVPVTDPVPERQSHTIVTIQCGMHSANKKYVEKSSCSYQGVRPLVDQFRSHVSKSLHWPSLVPSAFWGVVFYQSG